MNDNFQRLKLLIGGRFKSGGTADAVTFKK